MKLIIGLGNPGARYAHTRHNAGFLCVERIAEMHGWRFNQKRAESQVAEGEISYVRVVLAKPQTFMNNSGLAAARLMQSFRVSPADMLVIYDDIDLTAGVTHYPHLRFVGLTVLSASLWAAYSVGIGLFFGQWFEDNHFLGAAIAIVCAVALGIVVDLVINRVRRRPPMVERMKEPEA